MRLAYCNLLNRCPDPTGFQHFTQKIRLLGGQVHEIIRDLAMSPEFEQKHIRRNINAIENIYLKILGRVPEIGIININVTKMKSYNSFYKVIEQLGTEF